MARHTAKYWPNSVVAGLRIDGRYQVLSIHDTRKAFTVRYVVGNGKRGIGCKQVKVLSAKTADERIDLLNRLNHWTTCFDLKR